MIVSALLIIYVTLVNSFIFNNNKIISNKNNFNKHNNNNNNIHMTSTPVNGIIIGGGRIGTFLHDSNNKRDILFSSRSDRIPITSTHRPGTTGPIYLATRNNDLQEIINNTPVDRREDLVFLQNGVLTNFLEKNKLSDNTQGLIYLAVSKKGEKPIDGITDVNPEGLTAVTGKWANDFSLRLQNAGLTCKVLDKPTWTIAMLEKHIWICAFMAVGAKYKCNVGSVESSHKDEIIALIDELVNSATIATGVIFPDGVADRLTAYARSVGHFPTALKEFEWRNGWFIEHTFEALDASQPDPSPIHTQIIKEYGGDLYEKALSAWNSNKK
mmetsp:Transcript_5259/g.4736  ORF Transcript_5259/g.4736 Transcript_5259/m.4736 type:complete len:327 (-) Transcript_5259:125-1105(-)